MPRVLFVVVLLASLAFPSAARADDAMTPELATLALRARATRMMRDAALALSAAERARVVGAYVAFDDDPSDANAMAACDDDGDYVVVVTDAMLRLAERAAFARAADEATGEHALDAYGALLARAQKPLARLLPPPSGFYDLPRDVRVDDTFDARLDEALFGLVARELLHGARGDLTCPHPTLTKEQGDDVWTAAEQRAALDTANKLVDETRGLRRDAETAQLFVARGRTEQGFVALLDLLEKAAAGASSPVGRLHARLHGPAANRARAVRIASAVRSEARAQAL